MTVYELIKKLTEYDPYTEVQVYAIGWGGEPLPQEIRELQLEEAGYNRPEYAVTQDTVVIRLK